MEIKDIIALSVGAVILLIVILYLVINQKNKCIEWLKWAVTEAEKQLGTKTGQLKLHQVYSWFCSQFPIVSTLAPFTVFSAWVDVALKTLKDWLNVHSPEYNPQIAKYVSEGGESNVVHK